MSARTLSSRPDSVSDASARPGADTSSVAVALERLEKAFSLRPVLRNVTFSVEPGTCAAVLGPNGAGKTTLLRILACLAKPSGGTARVLGLDVARDASAIRQHVGYVGHSPLLYDELTVRENLLFFARMYGVPESERRVAELLDRVDMRARANERAGSLSRGQAQRVALARGLLHAPRLLLLDEPDTGLDSEAIELLTTLVREHSAAGGTSLVTTHALDRGLAMGQQTLVLVGGRVVYDGPSGALSPDEVTALYTAARARQVSR